MKRSLVTMAVCIGLGLAFVLALAACGSNGDGFLQPGMVPAGAGPGPGIGSGTTTSTPDTTPRPPVASAGPDNNVSKGSSVTLDGSGSYDPNGDPLVYSWMIELKPLGSRASLVNANQVHSTITVDVSGIYIVSLVVSDGTATSNSSRVTITAVNNSPVAEAGPGQSVDVGMTVTLAGSGSDVNRDSLTCFWTLYPPYGSAATLSSPYVCNPTFKPDIPGTYQASLTVDDGKVTSFPDEVTITAVRTVFANAGTDQYLTTGPSTVVTLDGSGSYDTHGRPVTCSWSFKAKPAGSTAQFSDPTAMRPSFTADVEGKYIVSLVANNGLADSTPDTAAVAVIGERPIDGLPDWVGDAAYSRQLDRIIMVSGYNLHVYDPVGKQDAAIGLSASATSLSLSPDGKFAAVGHNGSISYVNLVSQTTVTTLKVSGYLTGVSLAGNGYVYGFTDSMYAPIQCVNLSTGVTTSAGTYLPNGGVKAVSHPTGTALYGAPAATQFWGNFPPMVTIAIEKFDISSGGTTTFLYSSWGPGIIWGACGDLWMSEDGSRLFTRCGKTFPASTSRTGDLAPNGRLENLVNVLYAYQSTAAGKVAAIPDPASFVYTSADDTEVHIFGSQDLKVQTMMPLQRLLVNGTSYAEHGRYAFFSSDGTKLFVVVQSDMTAGGTIEYGIITY